MNKKEIRSEYIKNLMSEKEILSEELNKNTTESLKSLLGEKINESLRNIINESADDFEEEEVETDENPLEDNNEGSESEESVETSVDDNDSDVNIESDVEETETDTEDDGEDDEMWSKLEDFKGEDGEYDLTGMGTEDIVKVLKVMKPNDGVRVIKSDDQITIADDETEKAYVINLDCGDSCDAGDEDCDIEIETEDMKESKNRKVNEGKVDLGYTDNYQKQTAMTTPSNNEPAKNKKSWHKGIPTGTEKPWVGNKGNMDPYKIAVTNEEIEGDDDTIIEVDLGTENEPQIDEGQKGVRHGREGKHTRNHDEENNVGSLTFNKGKNISNEAKEKINNLIEENKKLKEVAEKLSESTKKAVVINSSLAKIINLVTENSTTKQEKLDIIKRFDKVNTLEESKALYESISQELKGAHAINNQNVSEKIDTVINESNNREQIVETSLYQSNDLQNTLSLMERMDRI